MPLRPSRRRQPGNTDAAGYSFPSPVGQEDEEINGGGGERTEKKGTCKYLRKAQKPKGTTMRCNEIK